MIAWILSLDPTVQVAILGVLGALSAGVFGLARAFLAPRNDEHEKEYGPKPIPMIFGDKDRAILETMIKSIDDLSDSIERHRVELSFKRK